MVNKSAIRACKCERVLKVCPPQTHTLTHTWCAQRVISLINSYAHSQGPDLGNSAAHLAERKKPKWFKFKLKHARSSIWFTNLSANTCSDNCKVVQIQILVLSLWSERQGERRFNSYAPNTNPHITIYIFIHTTIVCCIAASCNLELRISNI